MVQGLQTLYREQGTTAVLASKPVRVAGCVIGIVGALILYGLLQERIMYAKPATPTRHSRACTATPLHCMPLSLTERRLGCARMRPLDD